MPTAGEERFCHQCTSQLSLGVLYYNNPKLLTRQLAGWSKWPQAIWSKFEFIVVDHCSEPQKAAKQVAANLYMVLAAKKLDEPPPPVRILQILPPTRAWNIAHWWRSKSSDAHRERLLGHVPSWTQTMRCPPLPLASAVLSVRRESGVLSFMAAREAALGGGGGSGGPDEPASDGARPRTPPPRRPRAPEPRHKRQEPCAYR